MNPWAGNRIGPSPTPRTPNRWVANRRQQISAHHARLSSGLVTIVVLTLLLLLLALKFNPNPIHDKDSHTAAD